jgi:4-hydroxy-3-polyprenylbenzoate decarboxylase
VTRDPDTGIQNMGTYRGALKATDRLGVRMASRIGGAGGYLHWRKHNKRREPMPCAIVIGCAPVAMFTGGMKLAVDLDEMAVAGGLAGAPIRMARAVTVDLNVPADAEIVIEGLIDPDLLEPEGPFGESHGHVALEDFNMSMRVTAITHRQSPVFVSIISQVTPSESSVIRRVAMEPVYLHHLRSVLGIKGVKRVAMHEPLTSLYAVIAIQFARLTPESEIWRALHAASSLHRFAGKWIVAVDEDIEPDNADALFWAMSYRCQPQHDLKVVPHKDPGHGPRGPRDGGESAAVLINATLKGTYSPVALPKREFMEHAKAIWERLGLPPLTPQPPWHGYDLGHWPQELERQAEMAAKSDYFELGKNLANERRSDVAMNTPVERD